MTSMRCAVFGAGFWSRFHLCGWRELPDVRCVALCDPVRSRAEALAHELGVPAVHDDAEKLLRQEKPDFVDIVTSPDTHGALVHLAAAYRVPVICQKPMAPALAAAERMVEACRQAGASFFIHENWRWQTAIRAVKQVLDEGRIGRPFRARIDMNSGFPVFDNQPYLRQFERFILLDMGSHLLDMARFLFGEADRVCCHTQRVHADIRGEDVATVLLHMGQGTTVLCQMAFAGTYLEHDRFPETYCFIEGENGSVELGPDFWVRTTGADGTHARRYPPPRYSWADPAYACVHASIVSCHANLLMALRGEGQAETTGEDNLKTVRLIFAAYDSAATGQTVHLPVNL